MKVSDFSALGSLIRRTWTRKEGVILRMRRFGTQDEELLLCVGGARNPELVAHDCIVWRGDSKVYDGALDSADLRHLLTEAKVCYCEVTNARLMEHSAAGTFVCLLASAASNCTKECPLKVGQSTNS